MVLPSHTTEKNEADFVCVQSAPQGPHEPQDAVSHPAPCPLSCPLMQGQLDQGLIQLGRMGGRKKKLKKTTEEE